MAMMMLIWVGWNVAPDRLKIISFNNGNERENKLKKCINHSRAALFSLSIQIIENINLNLILQLLRHYFTTCIKISGEKWDNDDVVDSWRTAYIKYQISCFVCCSLEARTFQLFFAMLLFQLLNSLPSIRHKHNVWWNIKIIKLEFESRQAKTHLFNNFA